MLDRRSSKRSSRVVMCVFGLAVLTVLAPEHAPLIAAQPSVEEMAASEVTVLPPEGTVAGLPATTAGEWPLLALTGVLCLGMGVWFRRALYGRPPA